MSLINMSDSRVDEHAADSRPGVRHLPLTPPHQRKSVRAPELSATLVGRHSGLVSSTVDGRSHQRPRVRRRQVLRPVIDAIRIERVSMLEEFPEDLTSMLPGPELARMLAAVDLSRCTSVELFKVTQLRARQVSHENARLLETLLETAYADLADSRSPAQSDAGADPESDGAGLPPRVRELNEFSGDQLAFALVWSGPAMQAQVSLARDLIERLPVVFGALRTGSIDLPRAKVFSEALSLLSDDKALSIAERLIGKAEQWTPANLRRRLRYHARQADPSLARKRYQKSVTNRRAYLRPQDDGTTELVGANLPPDRAAAAFNRLDRVARAAKSSGDVRNLGQLRADAMLDLLSGRPFTLTPNSDAHTADADEAARNIGGDDTDSHNDPDSPPEPDTLLDKTTLDGQDAPRGHASRSTPGSDPSDEPGPELDPPPVASDDPRMCVCGGVQPAPRRGVVDLQMQLTTLLGLNDNPGLIPGYGPVLAEIARQVAEDQEANPAWKFSVTDADGNLLHHGHVRRRPSASERAFVKARDKTCRAPGCLQPASTCDDDHRQEWADNGPSHRGNLETACRHHHRLRHERGYDIHRLPDGTYVWQAPNGLRYPVPPDATFRLSTEDEPIPAPRAATLASAIGVMTIMSTHEVIRGQILLEPSATSKHHKTGASHN
jgi:Domain of unknown function (DUF222)